MLDPPELLTQLKVTQQTLPALVLHQQKTHECGLQYVEEYYAQLAKRNQKIFDEMYYDFLTEHDEADYCFVMDMLNETYSNNKENWKELCKSQVEKMKKGHLKCPEQINKLKTRTETGIQQVEALDKIKFHRMTGEESH